MTQNEPTPDAQEGQQQSLFEAFLPAPVDDPEHAITATDIFTKDPIYLADVAIAADKHVQKLQVRTLDAQGQQRWEERDGKILARRAPHPTSVMVDKRLVDRKQLTPDTDARAAAIMCELQTVVIYNRGVVQVEHVDVMHALLHLLQEDYKHKQYTNGTLRTTKAEINDIVAKARLNGFWANAIEEALQTLQGLTVTKIYKPPKESGASEVIEVLGAMIHSFTIHKNAGQSKVGRRPDVIEVVFSPQIVQSLRGDPNVERPYVLRNLNFTRNADFKVPWKRQAHRMIESRLDGAKRMFMPLKEMIVDCLGGDPKIKETLGSSALRKWKHNLRKFLEGDLKGYVMNVEWLRRPVDATEADDLDDEDDEVIASGDFVVRRSAKLRVAKAPYVEWIRIEKGPEFYAGRPQSRMGLAEDIVEAILGMSQVQRTLEALTADTVLDLGYERLRRFLTIIGDKVVRLPTKVWLSYDYARINRSALVANIMDSLIQEQRSFAATTSGERVSAPHFDRRERTILAVAQTMSPCPYHEHLSNDTQPETAHHREGLACYRLAYGRYLKKAGLADDIADPGARMLNDFKAQYERCEADALVVARRAAVYQEYFDRMEKIFTEKVVRPEAKNARAMEKALMMRYPEAYRIIHEMQRTSAPLTFQNVLAERYQLRLQEHLFEEDELLRLEGRR